MDKDSRGHLREKIGDTVVELRGSFIFGGLYTQEYHIRFGRMASKHLGEWFGRYNYAGFGADAGGFDEFADGLTR